MNGAKLTAVLHCLIVRALSKRLPPASDVRDGVKATNFVSQTAINMRRAAGAQEDEMGEFASGVYLRHARVSDTVTDGPLSEEEWAAARDSTEKFAGAASRLSDQPIGLLRYAPSIRKWMAGKLGQRRDCSYELSNVGVFDFEGEGEESSRVKIRELVFAQPGMVVGCPICVNVASVKGGSLVYAVTWPGGALEIDEGEEEFIAEVCDSVREDFERC